MCFISVYCLTWLMLIYGQNILCGYFFCMASIRQLSLYCETLGWYKFIIDVKLSIGIYTI